MLEVGLSERERELRERKGERERIIFYKFMNFVKILERKAESARGHQE